MSVVIKVFFAVLLLCTAAVVAVILAIHFRIKRHLREQAATTPAELETAASGSSAEVAVPEAAEGATPQRGEETSSTSL
jgi:Na+/H+-dicarboxylate symporter